MARDAAVQDFRVMRIWVRINVIFRAMREFFIPSYRPERHYMRGPGPACAKRGNGVMAR
jgi:hypothetical protein